MINSCEVKDIVKFDVESDTVSQYVEVVFDDGTFVALDEEELKNAALLAEKGCLDA